MICEFHAWSVESTVVQFSDSDVYDIRLRLRPIVVTIRTRYFRSFLDMDIIFMIYTRIKMTTIILAVSLLYRVDTTVPGS